MLLLLLSQSAFAGACADFAALNNWFNLPNLPNVLVHKNVAGDWLLETDTIEEQVVTFEESQTGAKCFFLDANEAPLALVKNVLLQSGVGVFLGSAAFVEAQGAIALEGIE